MAEVLTQTQLRDGLLSSGLRGPPTAKTYLGAPASYGPSRTHSKSSTDRLDLLVNSRSSSAPSSTTNSTTDLSQTSSLHSTPASSSSLSLNRGFDLYDDDDSSEDDSDMLTMQSYDKPAPEPCKEEEPVSPKTESPGEVPEASSCPVPISEDDTALRHEPSQHVDYLSHDWAEEDIWASWRHIVSKRRIYGERSRLENASWRTWAKSKYKLKTVSPETLNWLKDVDVTWLYGPLQTGSSRSFSQTVSEPASRLSKSNSFVGMKKPILKKRSASEVMLQKSISSSSLVKQAAAAVQAQEQAGRIRDRPQFKRAASDFVTSSLPSRTISRDNSDAYSSHSTSGLQTPAEGGERRHIRFDEKVEQCIAVDVKDDGEDDVDEWALNSDSSSDDGLIMMKPSARKSISRSNSRSSFSGESKTIAKLPSTKLKYRTDSPDIPEDGPPHPFGMFRSRSSKLSPSPSQETLRPSNPSRNFLIGDDDDDDEDIPWSPTGSFASRHEASSSRRGPAQREYHDPEGSGMLRRTESGMFMPYEEDDDEARSNGLIGRVVETVNTARDIAHVIWNVGWRK